MSEFEKARAERVSSVLDFYYKNFTEYLATVISFTEALPEEINNQIRDAFTHMSRAGRAMTLEEVETQCKAALAHIERANRDCLKASIIKARGELDNLVADVVFYHGFLTPAIKAQRDAISTARKEAYQLESRGDENQSLKLEEILRMTMALSDEVRAHYSVAGKMRTRVMRFVKRWFRPISFVIILLVGTILGVLIRPWADQLITKILG